MIFTTGIQRNVILNSGTLAIKTGSSALVKITNAVYFYQNGSLRKLAAADMPALVGTVTAAKFNVFVFYMDDQGTTAVKMGTEGATLGAIVFPQIGQGNLVLGFVIINPTGTGNFVGGSSALDDVTIVPNAFYINTNVGLYDINLA